MFETSEYNVTYLLGAGASAKALPTVKRTDTTKAMSEEFEVIAELLQVLKFDDQYKTYVLELRKNLVWLSENTKKYGTPDTFAKFLHLKNRKELPKLKNALTAFFLIEQFLNQKRDDRALIFLINIMERNIFPGNINILTWNYDFQIQLAAETFAEERFTYDEHTSLHSPPLIGYYPQLGHSLGLDSKEISMVHLNGIAGSYYHQSDSMFKSFFERAEEREVSHILKLLSNDSYNAGTSLSFAWENNNSSQSVELAKGIALKTDILVVVGYSFPFFNRRIDKAIFDSFKEANKLKTIYYQDPYKSGEFLRNQFQLPDEIDIRDIKEVDNYFVPLEL